MNWSQQQKEIFAFGRDSNESGIVIAVAGSGKSVTLEELAGHHLGGRTLILAFNKVIADRLKATFRRNLNVDVLTVNGLGNKILRSAWGTAPNIIANKYRLLMTKYGKENQVPYEDRFNILRLVDFVRVTRTDPGDSLAMSEMADMYSLPFHHAWARHVAALLEIGKQAAIDRKEIDYTDQVWLPLEWNLRGELYNNVLGDEIQDWSQAMIDLVLSCRRDNGRFIGVGDNRQAIYGFNGASSIAWESLRDQTNAKSLMLSTSYRCPRSHIALAQEDVSYIQAAEWAEEGELLQDMNELVAHRAQPGDLVICRSAAPLVKRCLFMISEGLPARMEGKDIGVGLTQVIDQVERYEPQFSNFGYGLKRWQDYELERLRLKDADDSQFAAIADRAESLSILRQAADSESYDHLRRYVDALFSANDKMIRLSTVHRAKGLEADRVFVLRSDRLGQRLRGQSEAAYLQERNLRYIARTRSRKVLNMCI